MSIMLDVTTVDDMNPAALAERIFDFLTEDMHDYFPTTTVDSFDYKVMPCTP